MIFGNTRFYYMAGKSTAGRAVTRVMPAGRRLYRHPCELAAAGRDELGRQVFRLAGPLRTSCKTCALDAPETRNTIWRAALISGAVIVRRWDFTSSTQSATTSRLVSFNAGQCGKQRCRMSVLAQAQKHQIEARNAIGPKMFFDLRLVSRRNRVWLIQLHRKTMHIRRRARSPLTAARARPSHSCCPDASRP